MIKYYPNILIIEVTRKCNIKCNHCMRGTSQDINIEYSYIDKLLDNIINIHCLSFSGGEPTLNVDAMEYTLKGIKKRKIQLDNFEIITNGKEITDRFIEFVNELISYCGRKEDCRLCRSTDAYHDTCSEENINQLKRLSCYKEYLINDIVDIGGAKGLDIADKKINKINIVSETRSYTCYGKMIQGVVYLTAKGDILFNCDYDYVNEKKYSLGNISYNTLEEIIDDRLYTAEVYVYADENNINLYKLKEEEKEQAILNIISNLKINKSKVINTNKNTLILTIGERYE